MTEHLPGGTAEIESLLADRERLQGWLDRLETTAAAAPASVRDRVRADYSGRLAEVVARLRGFTTALTASLETVRSQLAHLRSLKGEVEEARAEARLRHEVGEFGQEEWAAIDNDCEGKLQGLGGDIGRLMDEAGKLEEVLALVKPEEPKPEPAVQAAGPRRAPGDDVEVEVLETEEVTLVSHAKVSEEDLPVYTDPDQGEDATRETTRSAPVEAPRFTPRAGEARPRERERPTRTIRFPQPGSEPPASSGGVDEMTFLKSVTLDSPGQARGQAAEGKGSMKGAGRGPSTAAKSLKCTECGAMNRPTEWYCERCGAELAAL